jgi:prepilin-type N-terminal cleavage/methylation domain-containing protein
MVLKNQKGFTLIELLVVVAIIGILAAIAIPQFSAYRAQSFCSSVEADVKNTVTAEEAYFATYQAYGATPIQTTHGTATNTIATTMNATSTGTVTGSGANCVRPDGTTTFTFDQATGQYAWS